MKKRSCICKCWLCDKSWESGGSVRNHSNVFTTVEKERFWITSGHEGKKPFNYCLHMLTAGKVLKIYRGNLSALFTNKGTIQMNWCRISHKKQFFCSIHEDRKNI